MSKTKKKSKKVLIIILISLIVLIATILLAFFVYVSSYYHASDDVLDYMNDSDTVDVEENDDYIAFKPKNLTLSEGYIFYPGGKVEAKAYSIMMNEIAQKGITSILVKMPFNLAVFDINAADDVIKEFSSIKNWYIGGHSLGGAMASYYLSEKNENFKGLILQGAYSTKDLSSTSLHCLSLTASEDKIMNREKYEDNKKNLPSDTIEYEIEGGIHSYFGEYGHQDGDGEATITSQEQRRQVVLSSVSFILGKTVLDWLN